MWNILAARHRRYVSRRQALQAMGCGVSGMLPLLFCRNGDAAAARPSSARNLIYIFLCGGPSQLDMWDLKPQAPEDIRGVFRPISTNVAGIQISELLPRVAQHVDKLAIVRSMTHNMSDHAGGIARTLAGANDLPPGDVYVSRSDHPGVGALLQYLRTDDTPMPPWVVLPRPFTTSSPPYKGQSAGFLGNRFDPVVMNEPKIDSLASKDLKLPALTLGEDLTPKRLRQRQQLMAKLDKTHYRASAVVHDNQAQAYDLLLSGSARAAFDVTREPLSVRERYGRNEYGQSFLLARRLVEAGVRVVNVFWTYFDKQGCQFNLWDNHGVATDVCGTGGARTGLEMIRHPYCCPSFDQSFSALMDDLHQRGLLDETLVVVTGEFGRTPKINQFSGRDHWPHCYSQILAGGGVRGGQVYGTSDKHAAYVHDNPVTPADFAATILHAFGLSHDTLIYDSLQRPVAVSSGKPVEALF